MSTYQIVAILICLEMLLLQHTKAVPKQFSCMSYLEDDKSLQDDEFDFEDDISDNAILPPPPVATAAMPHRRICQSDYTFCFALWRQSDNGTMHVEKQGCWKESTDRNATCSQKECTSSAPTSRNNSLYYCCCSGDLCNQHVAVVEPAILQLSNEIQTRISNYATAESEAYMVRNYLLWTLGCVIFILIVIGAVVYYVHNGRERPEPEEAPLAPSGPGYSSNLRNVDNMNLISMLGTGKYGTVMKGMLHDQEVAVKIFPQSHYQYYINERNIYSLPMMDNPSLLTYFGYDERITMDGKFEYQLVLSLAPLGCLQDWLITNVLDFDLFCSMAQSITRGLSHLHTELRRGDEVKPCVAHRDLNTRNILVKADRTCCIADFGFALKVFGSKYEYKGEVASAETKSINEVGTLRYMSPELLEGAVNLRDCETSLKQMDVYALGLVLWEVATRCSDFYPPGQVIPPYKAPFELEVGAHPTFDQMLGLVVRHKARPLFPAGWSDGPAAKLVKDTCEDCWDHDAEARLTSICTEERMHEVAGLRPRLHTQPSSPLLSANNLTGEVGDHQRQSKNFTGENYSAPDIITSFNPPPNQQIRPLSGNSDGKQTNFGLSASYPQTEKNHLMHPQQQLQPFQGRNPCQERNLAPTVTCQPQVLIERSKKHSFQTSGQENSFSCLDNDVSVEDLISGGSSKKFPVMTANDASCLGQSLPKKQNNDKKLRGWHGVRALIQKKLFRNYDNNGEMFREIGSSYGDEKSNLMDNRHAATIVKGWHANSPVKADTAIQIDVATAAANGNKLRKLSGTTATSKSNQSTAESVFSHSKRPNNLNLSPMLVRGVQSFPEINKSNLLGNGNSEEHRHGNGNCKAKIVPMQSLDNRISTPSHVVPRSLSTSLIKHNNNNNNNVYETKVKTMNGPTTAKRSNSSINSIAEEGEQNFRRQRSLEVFREVFSGRGSTEKLRDPSQRVKTPGDVPPSVRKVRASKTLSLYDDRLMMDSSTLNIL